MRIILIISVFFISSSLFGQDAGTIILPSSKKAGLTRAVVFGISEYKDEEIVDLKYAHKDAEAFISYLQSDLGGSLTDEQLQLYTNEQATNAQIAAALDWLLEESKEGDLALIYFSGHSDVEIKFKAQNGYLLPHDSPPRSYTIGAFSFFLLDQYISAISDKNAEVIIISDACHSGKLAGSAEGGPAAATSSILNEFEDVLKILSCQPNEFSIEGPQWGGGRGVFSYFLMEGLEGNADSNQDLQISLKEIRRYLEDMVSEQAAPHQQTPLTDGDNNAIVAKLTESSEITSGQMMAKEVNDRALEKRVLESVSFAIKEKYNDFKSAIKAGYLMEPEGNCANDYYQFLSKEESIKDLHDLMRRTLAVALQNKIQEERNKLLESLLNE